jgi:hypothetical protein
MNVAGFIHITTSLSVDEEELFDRGRANSAVARPTASSLHSNELSDFAALALYFQVGLPASVGEVPKWS